MVWTWDWDWGVEAWTGLGNFCGRKRLGLGGIGMEVGVGREGFGGNGNMGGFCLGLVDLEFWRWGGEERVGKGLGKWGFGVEEGVLGSGGRGRFGGEWVGVLLE